MSTRARTPGKAASDAPSPGISLAATRASGDRWGLDLVSVCELIAAGRVEDGVKVAAVLEKVLRVAVTLREHRPDLLAHLSWLRRLEAGWRPPDRGAWSRIAADIERLLDRCATRSCPGASPSATPRS